MTNMGTAVLLLGVLFLLERTFVKDVGAVAARAAIKATNQAVGGLRAAADDLSSRIDSLQQNFSAGIADVMRRQDESIRRLKDSVSFDSVVGALEAAYSAGGLSQRVLTVPATQRSNGPRLTFRWFDRDENGESFRLFVSWEESDRPVGANSPSLATREWLPQASPTDLSLALMAATIEAGADQDVAHSLDLGFAVESLHTALSASISTRRGYSSRWFEGRLIEFLTDHSVISERGLEFRHVGLVAPSEAFATRGLRVPGRHRSPSPPKVSRPDGIGDAEWSEAIHRAQQVFSRSPEEANRTR